MLLLESGLPESGLEAVRLLERGAVDLGPADIPRLHALLRDPDVDPMPVARAGWVMLVRHGLMPTPDAAGARALEDSDFARDLLAETSVALLDAERPLTALRRWLLLSGRAGDFPGTVAALAAQARCNGGAWPFDAGERAALSGSPLAPAYLPERPTPAAPAFDRGLAVQYEGWPYPTWERVTRVPGDTLARRIAALGPDAPLIPDDARILVAGCGTGRETALLVARAPNARITAMDLSSASLAYARARHAAIGTTNVEFVQRDLATAADDGPIYDYINSTGVIHHLPDPEADWAVLARALKPGGVMGIMVYSKLARMRIRAAQRRVSDLIGQPVSDDLLREARARLIAEPAHAVAHSIDFASLGGVHDLLFNAHEDPFDVARVKRGVEALGLHFLGFRLPGEERRARYRQEYPHDPYFRDYAAWAATEFREPEMFAGMYAFWCMKPLQGAAG